MQSFLETKSLSLASNIATPQEDFLNSVLFNTYVEQALRTRDKQENDLLYQLIYNNDVDFCSTKGLKDNAEIERHLGKFDLKVDTSRTQSTTNSKSEIKT